MEEKMSNKKFVVTKYFDSYPTSPYCVCDTIEEARKKRDEANNKYRSAITDFHILVYGDEEKFNAKPYRTE